MDGLIKIGDFGLVTTIMDEHDENIGPLLNTHTNDVGTQLYMSPEQVILYSQLNNDFSN